MLLNKCLTVLLASLVIGTVSVSGGEVASKNAENKLIITDKIYSNIFVRKREEHKLVVKHLLSTEDYAKRFDLLKLALKEIIRVIQEDGENLRNNDLAEGSALPKNPELVDSLARYLENTCFFGELVLHFPDMSYRILKGVDGWRDLLIRALEYTRSFVNILDQKSLEMLGLLEQEIDESKRTDSYVNPYRERANESSKSKETKKKRKANIKKGPQLSGGAKTEL
uniref:Coiled-coil domain-containing protein 134 n=1 Tax=Culex pipiens TaxID=7175 RepID=A0A8D8BYC9_CULPI